MFSEDNNKEREFSEKEVNLILKRAIDLQKINLSGSQRSGNLSAGDLAKIAQETGINSEFIEQAIHELENKSIEKAHGLKEIIFGGPSTTTLYKELSSDIQKEKFEELIPVIHRVLSLHGQSTVIGNTFTWQYRDLRTGSSVNITVAQKAKKTVLELQTNLLGLKGGLFGGLMGGLGGGLGMGFGFGFGLGALHSFLFPIFWIPGVLFLSYLLARTIFKGISRSTKKKLQKLMKELIDIISEHKKITD
jgi:hypothetical protein